MFYMQYLSSLCTRRQWPEPTYEPYPTRQGYKCVVRVNNREYHTDGFFENDVLAQESAAMRAYLICRNFSVNDGMYPSGHGQGGVLQGLPVAIGTERRSIYSDDTDTSASSGSRSGGSSPGSDKFPSSYRDSRRRSEAARARVLTYGGSSRRPSQRR